MVIAVKVRLFVKVLLGMATGEGGQAVGRRGRQGMAIAWRRAGAGRALAGVAAARQPAHGRRTTGARRRERRPGETKA